MCAFFCCANHSEQIFYSVKGNIYSYVYVEAIMLYFLQHIKIPKDTNMGPSVRRISCTHTPAHMQKFSCQLQDRGTTENSCSPTLLLLLQQPWRLYSWDYPLILVCMALGSICTLNCLWMLNAEAPADFHFARTAPCRLQEAPLPIHVIYISNCSCLLKRGRCVWANSEEVQPGSNATSP